MNRKQASKYHLEAPGYTVEKYLSDGRVFYSAFAYGAGQSRLIATRLDTPEAAKAACEDDARRVA